MYIAHPLDTGVLSPPARGKPHYRKIEEGLHLGYRKPRGRRGKPAGAGKWVLRHYVGALADDFSDADGVAVLNFKQAQDAARAYMVQRAHQRAAAHIDPALGDVEVATLTADMLRKWYLTLAKKPARLRTERGKPQQHRDLDLVLGEFPAQRHEVGELSPGAVGNEQRVGSEIERRCGAEFVAPQPDGAHVSEIFTARRQHKRSQY
jgi:hypothetical protein